MGVAEGDVDAFVSHTLGDGHGMETHVDQQGNVRMAQVVDTNFLDACLYGAVVDFTQHKVFRDREDAVISFQVINGVEIFCQFLAEKDGKLDGSSAVGRFWRRDDVLALDAALGLGDGQGALI